MPYFLKTLGNVVQSSDKAFIQMQLLWFIIMDSYTALSPRRHVCLYVHVYYIA